MLGKLMLEKLEADDKAETVPLELQSTNLAIGKWTDHIACGPQSREGRSKTKEGVDVLAEDPGSGFPVVKGQPEGNLILESDVADKDGVAESGGPRLRKR